MVVNICSTEDRAVRVADDYDLVLAESVQQIVGEHVDVIQCLFERYSRVGLVVVGDIRSSASALVPADECVVVDKVV